MRSGGGSPEYQLSKDDFERLSCALGTKFNKAGKERLQAAVNQALYWGSLEFNADAKPIVKFYDEAARRTSALSAFVKSGAKSQDHDVKFFTKYAFDNNRRFTLDPDLVHLALMLDGTSLNFQRAKSALLEKHVDISGVKTGPKPTPGLNRLTHILAEFSEESGVTPSEAYDQRLEDRQTPFIRFVDEMRSIIGHLLPSSKVLTETIVRRVLTARRKRLKNANPVPSFGGVARKPQNKARVSSKRK